ncbi:acyl carrier protein [Micromonospora sp. NPDC023956]|uniref:acyl carrier protein n=1 Tax=Micromonospora sp. NPDC023956 TaxID=3155722 RepID=UPI0033F0EE11
MTELTLEDLLHLLAEHAGGDRPAAARDDAGDVPFDLLGYDSLTVLRTVGHLETVHRVTLPDAVLRQARTPRHLVEQTNAALRHGPATAEQP